MNIMTIANVNIKGQVVIPKEMRKKLNIDQSVPLSFELFGESIVIKPIRGIITNIPSDQDIYLEVLKRAKGSWKAETTEDKKRRQIEIDASRRNKKAW
jgi:AbrB family looped-hinge helix DNA binding protein